MYSDQSYAAPAVLTTYEAPVTLSPTSQSYYYTTGYQPSVTYAPQYELASQPVSYEPLPSYHVPPSSPPYESFERQHYADPYPPSVPYDCYTAAAPTYGRDPARSYVSPPRDRPYEEDPYRSRSPPVARAPVLEEEARDPDAPVNRKPINQWTPTPLKSALKSSGEAQSSSLTPFPQTGVVSALRDDSRGGYRPEYDQIRPAPKAERRAMAGGEDDAFSLALSEVTTVTPDHLQLSLGEELILLKAGDKPKFSKDDRLLDAICSCALLLDLVAQKRVGPDAIHDVNPRNLVLRVLDDTPTGSKLADSALSSLQKKPKSPPNVQYWIKKASPELSNALLWRLVNKGKLSFDPRTFGADRFPVKAFKELNEIRERVMAVAERTVNRPPLKDLFLTFLYYLPSDASSKVFSDRDDHLPEVAHIMAKAVAFAVAQETRKQTDHFI